MSAEEHFDESWVEGGCLPPDDGELQLQRLEADAAAGRIKDNERILIATNAIQAFSKGRIDMTTHKRVLQALKVDTDGTPLD